MERSFQIFFVLRAFADIDHLTPIIYYLSRQPGTVIGLFGADPTYEYDKNNRIALLKTLPNVSFRSSDEAISKSWRLIRRAYLRIAFLDIVLRWKTMHKVLFRLRALIEKRVGAVDFVRWLPRAYPSLTAMDVCVFDSGAPGVSSVVLAAARKLGARTVSCPHCVDVWKNRLRTTTWLGHADTPYPYESEYKIFDHVLLVNHYNRRLEEERGLSADKIRVLGSARFSRTWVHQKEALLGEVPFQVPGAKGTRVLFLCPRPQNNVFWDEVLRTLHIFQQYKELTVVVKLPVRGREDLRLTLKRYPHLHTVDNAFSTGALTDWADVVMFVDTTVFFEALVKGKTLVKLDHLHINKMHVDGSPGIWESHSRDDLVEILETIAKNPNFRPYSETDVAALLNGTAYVGHCEPVRDYVSFLTSLRREDLDRPKGIC